MREQQRRDSARAWIRSRASVTVKSYAKRYGVDSCTAYNDLAAVGFTLPASAQQWAQRPPAPSPRAGKQPTSDVDTGWIMLDGRLFFVAGDTPGGAPYGIFEDEMQPQDDPA
jgi:mannose-6-phosphate isomerase-like protein (cupin superfamily)